MSFIKIDRKLLEHTLWLSEPFTKGQAWVDIIARANFSDREKFYRGEMYQIKRGQLPTSDIELANRWRWSRNKVRTYLSMLERAGMITTERTTKGTVITVENYGKYQDDSTSKSTEDETIESTTERHQKDIKRYNRRTSKGTTEGTHNKKEKKDKKDKKEKNNNKPTDFEVALEAFTEMRMKIKKPMTDHAKDLLMKKLDKLSGGNEEIATAILNQSILNGWQGVFELKEPFESKKPNDNGEDSII